ncbi:unnamed protein product [Ectocarpus sp. 6 AP-2014]
MPGHTGDWNMYFTWARAEGQDGVCEQTSWETDNTGHSPEVTVDGAPAKPATMDRSALGHFDEFTADGFSPLPPPSKPKPIPPLPQAAISNFLGV